MKSIVLLTCFAIFITSKVSYASGADCVSYLAQNTRFSSKAASTICYDSTAYTTQALYWSLTHGYQMSDSLALMAGGATAWTAPCLDKISHYFKESYSLAMICRGISKESYESLVNPQNDRFVRDDSTNVARLFSPHSFESFLQTFFRVEGQNYCDQYTCN